MAGEPITTVVGNLTGDPELRFTPAGAAVANFTVASTPRTFDRQAGEWRDGETWFLRCSVWREYAENVAESLTKGASVIVYGRLVQRSSEDKEGNQRSVVEMQVEEVGPALGFATAQVSRAPRQGSGGGGFQQQPQSQGDPWGGQQSQGQDWPVAAQPGTGQPPF